MTDHPDKVTVFEGGFVAGELDFSGGEAFWSRLEELGAATGPAEHLDAAMGGKPAPRTWLFLHPPGRGEMSAAAALSFARALAERDQSSLVLDADEVHGALTDWIGRRDQEGWIDLARYGTSVLTSGITLPFPGRRGYVMGVGSFTPTDVTAEEIKALMARLRRQADDILVTAPADGFGLAWASAADARILCWDPATLSRVENEELTLPFAEAGAPVTGVMAFGELPPPGMDAPEDILVEDVLAETEEEVPDHEGFPVPEVDEPDEAPVGDDPEVGEEDGKDEDDDDGWGDPGLGVAQRDEEEEPGRKTSGVFWFSAVAAVLVIAVAFVYWFKVLRVPSEGHFENVPTVASNQTPTRPASPTGGSADAAGALADTQEAGTEDGLAEVVQADTLTSVDGPAVEEGGAAMDETLTQVDETSAETADETVTPPPADTTPAEPEETAAGAFDMTPFQEPVGQDGWALHVYSLPSMESMQDQLKELERRGFKTAVKAVDVEGKGRWYRVYLGNFASRAAADAAKPGLLEKLGEEYAATRRFEASTSE